MACGKFGKKGHEEHWCVDCGRPLDKNHCLPCPIEIYRKCKKGCMWIPYETGD